MDDFKPNFECKRDELLIAALYKWSDTEHEARNSGEPMLAFFIAVMIEEIKAILNIPHR